MRNDGTNNTGKITRGKGNSELSTFAISLLGFDKDMGIEELDNLLKEEELGHRVGNLHDVKW